MRNTYAGRLAIVSCPGLQSGWFDADTTAVLNRFAIARAVILALVAIALIAGRSQAAQIMLSTTQDATLAGTSFRNGDVVLYDDSLNTVTLLFSEDAFTSGNESLDSFQQLPNGHWVFSTGGGATLGGLTFRDGDGIDYDPVNDVATLLFSEDLFATGANLDGFQVLPNGHFLLSTVTSETLAGLSFDDGDIVEYDPVTLTATLFLDETTTFSTNSDIGGFNVLADGRIAFSTLSGATLSVSGLSFQNGDVVLFDPSNGSASIIFSESSFGADQDVDGVQIVSLVPEPGTGLLASVGLLALAGWRRSARRRFATR